ncbi:hypothetical protein [Planomicrobium sp. YIM 101495]|uniref:hypothetical protein n=1 Tax=Planomicrobium sp. YIM 101495 TaxID=2665160 RepID=UPI0012B72498|nr:hypothetical protein [Planomicrobium sp. YIM 101495]MTD29849.1 hypothetical protein [Planomicrobium sp. YIM 101495]
MEQSNNFVISIENQKWIDENEEMDLSSHGEIHLAVDGTVITGSGMDEEWGISESALALLRTVDHDYRCAPEDEEGLILHGCGAVLMMGCPISIHWTVQHMGDQVLLSDFVKTTTTDPTSGSFYYPELQVILKANDYKRQIVQFAEQAKEFFAAAKEKRIDDEDRSMYEEFWAEYNRLLEEHAHSKQ